jgi:hypothetical protein
VRAGARAGGAAAATARSGLAARRRVRAPRQGQSAVLAAALSRPWPAGTRAPPPDPDIRRACAGWGGCLGVSGSPRETAAHLGPHARHCTKAVGAAGSVVRQDGTQGAVYVARQALRQRRWQRPCNALAPTIHLSAPAHIYTLWSTRAQGQTSGGRGCRRGSVVFLGGGPGRAARNRGVADRQGRHHGNRVRRQPIRLAHQQPVAPAVAVSTCQGVQERGQGRNAHLGEAWGNRKHGHGAAEGRDGELLRRQRAQGHQQLRAPRAAPAATSTHTHTHTHTHAAASPHGSVQTRSPVPFRRGAGRRGPVQSGRGMWPRCRVPWPSS